MANCLLCGKEISFKDNSEKRSCTDCDLIQDLEGNIYSDIPFYLANYNTLKNIEIFQKLEQAKEFNPDNPVYKAVLNHERVWYEKDFGWNYENTSDLFLETPYIPDEFKKLQKLSEAKFKPGDKVDFVNDNGVIFRDKIIEKVEINHNGEIGYITKNSETPWFASPEKNFYPAGEYKEENKDLILENGLVAKFVANGFLSGEKIFEINDGGLVYKVILTDGNLYSISSDTEEAQNLLIDDFQPKNKKINSRKIKNNTKIKAV